MTGAVFDLLSCQDCMALLDPELVFHLCCTLSSACPLVVSLAQYDGVLHLDAPLGLFALGCSFYRISMHETWVFYVPTPTKCIGQKYSYSHECRLARNSRLFLHATYPLCGIGVRCTEPGNHARIITQKMQFHRVQVERFL
jgi:hypothetical protein